MLTIYATKMYLSMFVVALTPDYTIATNNNQLYICPMIDHCKNDHDDCLDTYQMIEFDECFNCSNENNAFTDFCDNSIPFDYSMYKNTTFYYVDSNITTNMYTIAHTDLFSSDDYIEFLTVFAADCLELREPATCNDALYLASHLSDFLSKPVNND